MMSGRPLLTGARQRTLAVVVIIALGLTLTFILFQARVLDQTTRQGEFSQRAALGATALQRSMQEHLEVLYGLAALYATAAQPLSLNREAFRELTKGPNAIQVSSRSDGFHASRKQSAKPTWQPRAKMG